MAHIARIVGEVYGSRVSAATHKQGIPLQEKLALCTLLMILKSGKAKEVQLGKVKTFDVVLNCLKCYPCKKINLLVNESHFCVATVLDFG